MNALQARQNTSVVLGEQGIVLPYAAIPSLGELADGKSTVEIAKRSLALFASICIVAEPTQRRRYAKEKVRRWLTSNGIGDLSRNERALVFDEKVTHALEVAASQELDALYALTWSIGLVEKLDPEARISATFGEIFPNIELDSPAHQFISEARKREPTELINTLDKYFCLDWAFRESSLTGAPPPIAVPWLVVRKRRFALEWILSENEWDEISLDT